MPKKTGPLEEIVFSTRNTSTILFVLIAGVIPPEKAASLFGDLPLNRVLLFFLFFCGFANLLCIALEQQIDSLDPALEAGIFYMAVILHSAITLYGELVKMEPASKRLLSENAILAGRIVLLFLALVYALISKARKKKEKEERDGENGKNKK